MIYHYLVPNVQSVVFCGSPQRNDGPCYPAVLSLNRDLRQEILSLWYSPDVHYQANIDSNGVQCLGHRFMPYEQLPRAFQHIEFLCISIKLEWRPKRQQTFKKHMSQMLPSMNSLKRLEISKDVRGGNSLSHYT